MDGFSRRSPKEAKRVRSHGRRESTRALTGTGLRGNARSHGLKNSSQLTRPRFGKTANKRVFAKVYCSLSGTGGSECESRGQRRPPQ